MVGAVIERDGLILAAKRGKNMSLAGFWEFPGGKIEAGETPEEALARELKEELLCDASIGDHIDTSAYEYDFGMVNLATYHATLTGNEPRLTEHEEVRWIAPADLVTLNWAPADLPTIHKITAALH